MPSDLRSSGRSLGGGGPAGRKKGRMKIWSGEWVVESFKAFGRHCARNQIRVLLIDSFVMTTLFYPALALHLQRRFPLVTSPQSTTSALHSRINAKQHPLSLLSTPILDSVFPEPEPVLPYPPSTLFWDVEKEEWEGRLLEVKTGETRGIVKPPSVVAVNVAWTSVRRGLTSPAFGRLELPGTEKEDDKILDSFERELDKLAMEWYVSAPSGSSSSGSSCVRNPTDRTSCLTTYENPLSHPPPQPNQPGDEIYVLASNSIWESKTYYFVQEDKTSSSQSQKEFRRDWVQAVSDLGARWGAGVQSLGVKRAAKGEDWLVSPRLSKNSSTTTTTTTTTSTTSSRPLPNNFPTFSPAAIPLPIIFLYFLLMAYIMFCLSNAHQAHSRFGLAFTGIIELGCSTVMSFSVMILFGWGGERWNQVAEMDALNGRGVAGVPWYLLPFVVVIVGAENMSAVTAAVYSIPVTYSVPDRLGEALGKVGKSLFVTSVLDIIVLTLIRLTVSLRPVKDLCTFASVLIFVDWWMLHTFYLTVLSIDCQRLDLADLIKQGSLAPQDKKLAMNGNGVAPGRYEDASGRPVGGKLRRLGFISKIKNMLRTRSTRGISSLLLLALLTALYYANESHQSRALRMAPTALRPAPPVGTSLPDMVKFSPRSSSIWKALYAGDRHTDSSILTIASLPPSMLVIPSSSIPMTPDQLLTFVPPLRKRLIQRLKPLFYLFKVVLLPQAVTAFSLYLVLLYLLKDADALEAQRGKDLPETRMKGLPPREEADRSTGSVKTRALVRDLKIIQRETCGPSDIRQRLVSSRGDLALAITGNGKVFVSTEKGTFRLDLPEGGSLKAAVSEDGYYFVVTTGTILFVYQIKDQGKISLCSKIAMQSPDSPIASISLYLGISTPPAVTYTANIAHQNGALRTIIIPVGQETRYPVRIVDISEGKVDQRFVRMRSSQTGSGMYAIGLDNVGQVDIRDSADEGWIRHLQGNKRPGRKVTAVDIAGDGGDARVALGTSDGSIEIWDVNAECLLLETSIQQLAAPDRQVRQVKILYNPEAFCASCKNLERGNVTVIWSTSSTVGVLAATDPSQSSFCACAWTRDERKRPSPRPTGETFLTPTRASKASSRRRSSLIHVSPVLRARTLSDANGNGDGARHGLDEDHALEVQVSRGWALDKGAWAVLPESKTLMIVRRSEGSSAVNGRWEAAFIDLKSNLTAGEPVSSTSLCLDSPSNLRRSEAPRKTPTSLSLAEKRERAAREWEQRSKPGEPSLTLMETESPVLAFSLISEVVPVNGSRVDVVAGNIVIQLEIPLLPLGSASQDGSVMGSLLLTPRR